MSTDLAQHIQSTPLIDTHEHLEREDAYLAPDKDVLCALFQNYVTADLVSAGASRDAVGRLVDASDPDIAGRFEDVRQAWSRCRHTGYGRAVTLIAERLLHIDEISADTLPAAQERFEALHRPGERLRMLKETANLDHVQVDDGRRACEPDESDFDFFLYDLSWLQMSDASFKPQELFEETGIEVKDLASLREAIAAVFAAHAPCAIAVKTQHSYTRTLRWQARSDSEAEEALIKKLAGDELDDAETLTLGDWCLVRGVEQAIEHRLPIKVHTGYYAGVNHMITDRIRAGHLCPLLIAYPEARFVLMHIAYPYEDEIVALAKHFPNVWIDMCWAWSIDPYSAERFVRKFVHAVPVNRLFVFGGDARLPTASVAYAIQTRAGLTAALQSQIDAGALTEHDAIDLAARFMQTNQREVFDLEGTRAAIREAAAALA